MVDLPITTALIGGEQAVAGLNREAAAVDKTTKATQKKTQAQRESEKAIKAETRARLMAERQSARDAQRSSRLVERGRLRDQTAMERLQARDYRRQAREQARGGTRFSSIGQRTAHAVGGAAGALGGVFGLGALGPLGVGIGVAAVGLRLLGANLENNAQAIQAEIKFRNEHTDALKKAREAVRGQALGYARGGAKTEAALDALGVQRGQVKGQGGDAALLTLAQKGMASERNLNLVNQATATSLASAEEAAAAIIKGARTAAEILQMTHDRRFSMADVDAAIARTARSPSGQIVRQEDAAAIKVQDAERRSAMDGSALQRELSKIVVDARDPALQEERKLLDINNRALRDLSETIERMDIVSTWWDMVKHGVFGGGKRGEYAREAQKMDEMMSAPAARSNGATP
jgi:hypothetical protein